MIDLPTDADPVRIIQGDCLDVLRQLPDGCVDAVVTDPPYSSGGLTRGDRTMAVATKYVQSSSDRFKTAGFEGDNRDQRSWSYWCHLWLCEAMRATKPGGYFLIFTDWRQLPTLTDVVQAAGWVWRGILSWDKGPGARSAAPHYFRHQCEYVVWGTRGPCNGFPDWPPPGKGCYPGAYFCPVTQSDKHHVTGKPTQLMRDLMRPVPVGGLVLDPFAGSGTTLVAAAIEGRRAIGIEFGSEYCEIVQKRLRAVKRDVASSLFSPSALTLRQPASAIELIPGWGGKDTRSK